MFNINKEVLVYEAAYVFEKHLLERRIAREAVIAAGRILDAAGIPQESGGVRAYRNAHPSETNERSAALLYEKLVGQGWEHKAFFASLSDEAVFVYHAANFKISYEYGRQLAAPVDFSNQKILDVGGSSGGLVCGIKSVYGAAVCCHVFDTAHAAQAAAEIKENEAYGIVHIQGSFFQIEKEKMADDYNTVILSNVIHDWNDRAAARIFSNVIGILNPGARLLIYEDMLYDSEKEPVEALLYGLRLCANVPGGRQRTFSQMEGLLNGAAAETGRQFIAENAYDFGEHSAVLFRYNR